MKTIVEFELHNFVGKIWTLHDEKKSIFKSLIRSAGSRMCKNNDTLLGIENVAGDDIDIANRVNDAKIYDGLPITWRGCAHGINRVIIFA